MDVDNILEFSLTVQIISVIPFKFITFKPSINIIPFLRHQAICDSFDTTLNLRQLELR